MTFREEKEKCALDLSSVPFHHPMSPVKQEKEEPNHSGEQITTLPSHHLIMPYPLAKTNTFIFLLHVLGQQPLITSRQPAS